MFLHRSKSQGLMSGECEAYFTDLHCNHAREVFHTGGIMNGGLPVHYGSISPLQGWWRILPHEILHISGMSFRCAVSLCDLLQPHWLTVLSTFGTPFTHCTVPAIAKLLCHQSPEYPQWQRFNTIPLLHTSLTVLHSMFSDNSEFIQEHIPIRKYCFVALHYDCPTSLVYTRVISACRSITWFIYSLPVQLPGNCEFSRPR
jgi:hypothetical protein